MVNNIIDGISNVLYENFKGVSIHSESIEQGFEEPCFFVVPLNSSETPLVGARAIRNVPLDIHYFPKSKTAPNAEIEGVAAKLYVVLRRISLLSGEMLNGMDLHHEIENGVLHFFVKYTPIVRYVGEPDEMQNEITHNVGVI